MGAKKAEKKLLPVRVVGVQYVQDPLAVRVGMRLLLEMVLRRFAEDGVTLEEAGRRWLLDQEGQDG